MPYALFAHKKDDLAVPAYQGQALKASALLDRDHPGDEPWACVLGVDDYLDFDARDGGGFQAWAYDVSTRYDAIVVPDQWIGMGVASVVRYALESNIPVYFFDVVGQMLVDVRELVEVNGKDWKAGWRLPVV